MRKIALLGIALVLMVAMIALPALVGSSAFGLVIANREMEAKVKKDPGAYLKIEILKPKYAYIDGMGRVNLRFKKLNPDAITAFYNVIKITNMGTETVTVYIEPTPWFDHADIVRFFSIPSNNDLNATGYILDPGESVNVGVQIFAYDLGAGEEIGGPIWVKAS